jgi:hypothetical protein
VSREELLLDLFVQGHIEDEEISYTEVQRMGVPGIGKYK